MNYKIMPLGTDGYLQYEQTLSPLHTYICTIGFCWLYVVHVDLDLFMVCPTPTISLTTMQQVDNYQLCLPFVLQLV